MHLYTAIAPVLPFVTFDSFGGLNAMNLADAKRQFESIVEQHGDGMPLDAAARAAILVELTHTYKLAMQKIDGFTAEQRGRRPGFLPRNTRNGLLCKLDRLYLSAKAELGLD
ncbi:MULTISPECIES: hypothetical protein [unclassified Streptomyces]|uniref:hypothetical protein n=1 Tax=Streptomyces sp. NPDC127129 TaxID=3345373 RepID=UPI003644A699